MGKNWIYIFIIALLMMGPFSASANQHGEEITRGEFFNLIVNHLALTPSDTPVEMPSDVKEDSEFASAVKVLKGKGIIQGYPDGTVRLDQEVTPQEVSYVIGRFLNMNDKNSAEALTNKFNLDITDQSSITKEEATNLVTSTLTSDEVALNWIEQMSIAQNELNSFRATSTVNMEMNMQSEELEQVPSMPTSFNINAVVNMDFNMEQGLHQEISMKMPMSMPNGSDEMTMEQYYVPEGIFMKMPDPQSGNDVWMNMSDSMPLTFDQLMQMNQENLKVNAELNNQFFFYRDLGVEEVDGKTMRKIEMNGKINSLAEMMSILNGVMDNSMIPQEQINQDMKIGISGITWIDEETALPYKQVLDYSLQFTGDAATAGIPMPSGEMQMNMEMTYSDFNNVNDITLPEAAKNAEKMPVPGKNQTDLSIDISEELENTGDITVEE